MMFSRALLLSSVSNLLLMSEIGPSAAHNCEREDGSAVCDRGDGINAEWCQTDRCTFLGTDKYDSATTINGKETFWDASKGPIDADAADGGCDKDIVLAGIYVRDKPEAFSSCSRCEGEESQVKCEAGLCNGVDTGFTDGYSNSEEFCTGAGLLAYMGRRGPGWNCRLLNPVTLKSIETNPTLFPVDAKYLTDEYKHRIAPGAVSKVAIEFTIETRIIDLMDPDGDGQMEYYTDYFDSVEDMHPNGYSMEIFGFKNSATPATENMVIDVQPIMWDGLHSFDPVEGKLTLRSTAEPPVGTHIAMFDFNGNADQPLYIGTAQSDMPADEDTVNQSWSSGIEGGAFEDYQYGLGDIDRNGPCPEAGERPNTYLAPGIWKLEPILCEENQHVISNACNDCPDGQLPVNNWARHDANGGDTACTEPEEDEVAEPVEDDKESETETDDDETEDGDDEDSKTVEEEEDKPMFGLIALVIIPIGIFIFCCLRRKNKSEKKIAGGEEPV